MQTTYSRDRDENNKEKMGEFASSAIRQGEEKIKNMASNVERQLKEGEVQVREMAALVDKKLHENPWPIVAGVALSSLLVGFVMGVSKRRD